MRAQQSAFDRWLTTDLRDRDAEALASKVEVEFVQPDPCPSCEWVGAHETGCRNR